MLGYEGEDVPVLCVEMSDVSDEEDGETAENDQLLDPSDPRSHGVEAFKSYKEEKNDEEEETKQDEVKKREYVSEKNCEKSTMKLSKWAMERFMTSRKGREEMLASKLQEMPIEPLNDHILSDFGTRVRHFTQEEPKEAKKDRVSEDMDVSIAQKLCVGPPLPLDPKSAAEEAKMTDTFTRKRPDRRYFVTDLSTKCFNCGQTGHLSNACTNTKLLKPCYFCGISGHNSYACPRTPCGSCLQIGHITSRCSNRSIQLNNCKVCGRIGHTEESCQLKSKDVKAIKCMVCMKTGHSHCTPLPQPSDRRLFCPNCAGNHRLKRCRNQREGIRLSDVIPSFSSSNVKCFLCNHMGHIAAECSHRKSTRDGACFRCDDYGHMANACPEFARDGSRKRSRLAYNGNDRSSYNSNAYHDTDAGYTEHSKFTKPNHSSSGKWKASSNPSSAYNRLNAALSSPPSSFRRGR
uniref:Uncharacterized protein AlNc14C37G3276 n=1 Tax=Albugo laibachii Nc14 TaxID=890382 RepID=F0W906_9STRA|nr:conserved hypothetical protein [Albugo laibachii Nc14]|eukprot:CCA17617.1 conserved hypothetical protein [Albugo laibachii Nc14]